MSTTPTTPQWAIEAAKEIAAYFIKPAWCVKADTPFVAAIIAKRAPTLPSAPTDEAELREKIVEILQHYNPTIRTGYGDATRRIMDLFAPHLSQRPARDALELENAALREMLYATSTGMRGYHDDGELQDNREQPFIDFKRDSIAEIRRKNYERNVRALSAPNAAPQKSS